MSKYSKYIKNMKNYGSDMKKRPISTTLETPGRALNSGAELLVDGVVDVASAIHKGTGKVPGLGRATRFTKKTNPGIENLWTGRREGGGAIIAAAGIGAGYAGWQSLQQTTLAPKLGITSYGGTAPIMNADGVSNTPQAPLSNAPTLGAGGNMVFGLHNARKG